jgi:hypothetical protein
VRLLIDLSVDLVGSNFPRRAQNVHGSSLATGAEPLHKSILSSNFHGYVTVKIDRNETR